MCGRGPKCPNESLGLDKGDPVRTRLQKSEWTLNLARSGMEVSSNPARRTSSINLARESGNMNEVRICWNCE